MKAAHWTSFLVLESVKTDDREQAAAQLGQAPGREVQGSAQVAASALPVPRRQPQPGTNKQGLSSNFPGLPTVQRIWQVPETPAHQTWPVRKALWL